MCPAPEDGDECESAFSLINPARRQANPKKYKDSGMLTFSFCAPPSHLAVAATSTSNKKKPVQPNKQPTAATASSTTKQKKANAPATTTNLDANKIILERERQALQAERHQIQKNLQKRS